MYFRNLSLTSLPKGSPLQLFDKIKRNSTPVFDKIKRNKHHKNDKIKRNSTPIFDKIKKNEEEKPHLSPLIAANLRAACLDFGFLEEWILFGF